MSESVSHRFQGPPDAAFAYNGMVADAGNFYGATVHGGADDQGAIYQFMLNQPLRQAALTLPKIQVPRK
jgi:uncharacterized repeat protein (TIGR03803 family)